MKFKQAFEKAAMKTGKTRQIIMMGTLLNAGNKNREEKKNEYDN